jgi:hypothetical protein
MTKTTVSWDHDKTLGDMTVAEDLCFSSTLNFSNGYYRVDIGVNKISGGSFCEHVDNKG